MLPYILPITHTELFVTNQLHGTEPFSEANIWPATQEIRQPFMEP